MATKKVLKVIFGTDGMARIYRGTMEQCFSLDKYMDWKRDQGGYKISEWALRCNGRSVADCEADGWLIDELWTTTVYTSDLRPYAVFTSTKDLAYNVRMHMAIGYDVQYATKEL